ncbi:MAG: site-specific recombinase for integration and excision [Symbiobacteriaceae bacterium]|nr:site-specific recombinase for integration and excision [Symbiobacteriaceae bacterium]
MQVAKSIDPGRVAVYIRWSTEDQGEGTTLEVQREACRTFIRSHGWVVSDSLEYVDDGLSGGSLERPALARLRAAVSAGLVDCVVVYKLDRLSRSVVDMVRLVLDEWEGRCHVKSAREPIDTVSQAGRLFFYQLMSFAEWERSVIRERTFAGKLRRAQEGRNPGMTAAYGYRLGAGGALVVEPGEAQVVQLIFGLYLSGMGCTQIGLRLGELGYPSPAGRRWGSGQVSRLLSNPVYMGTLVYGKQTSVRGRRVKSERPHVVREGAVPAIVSAAEFAAVQALKAGRPGVGRAQGSGRSLSSQSLLTGLLRCGCGRALCGSGGSGDRFRYRYYYCGASGGGAALCRGGRIRQAELDRAVTDALLRRLRGEESALRGRVAAALDRATAVAEAAAAAAERDLARAKEKGARLRTLVLEGGLSAAAYRELRRDVQAHLEDAAERAVRARAEVERAKAAGGARAGAAPPDLAQDLSAHWHTLDLQEQKRLLRQFISRVTAQVDRESGVLDLTITWHSAGGER